MGFVTGGSKKDISADAKNTGSAAGGSASLAQGEGGDQSLNAAPDQPLNFQGLQNSRLANNIQQQLG
jgi:hypothetical protein